jgi:hypothetical protein
MAQAWTPPQRTSRRTARPSDEDDDEAASSRAIQQRVGTEAGALPAGIASARVSISDTFTA